MNDHNTINWFEIPVLDMDRATSFYEAIFDIKLSPLTLANGLKMALFPETDGYNSGSLCYYPEFYKPGNQGPLIYLNANPSIAAVLEQIERTGGKVLIPKNQISEERGFMAVFEDTEGNRIALNAKA
jgi:predicted enzyme related to lactoylglutathione lyase